MKKISVFPYQTVQYFIWSKNGVLYITVFKYSLPSFSVSAGQNVVCLRVWMLTTRVSQIVTALQRDL